MKSFILNIAIASTLTLGLITSATADYRDADENITIIFEDAIQGDNNARFQLGFMYETGLGVPQNYTTASEWYHKAAINNHAGAMTSLGNLHYDGAGLVPQSFTSAMNWYQKAAWLKYAPAQNRLAIMYEHGLGTPVNKAEAMQWYQKACHSGAVDACYNFNTLSHK